MAVIYKVITLFHIEFLEKRDYDFVRFGRSDGTKKAAGSYDYIRFGKRSSYDYIRFGKRAYDYIRFGKRSSSNNGPAMDGNSFS